MLSSILLVSFVVFAGIISRNDDMDFSIACFVSSAVYSIVFAVSVLCEHLGR